MDAYQNFIASKRREVKPFGFDAKGKLNPNLFDWQRRVTRWALQRGRAAIFAECGLGKTLMQLTWAEHVHKHTRKPVVIHTPVGVRQQTKREATKFGISCDVAVVDDANDVVKGINLVNYEKLHKFESIDWSGVVLDESSILKGIASKTKAQLIDRYGSLKYRLACTATPAPNDHMELGNHAEFLGVCESVDMLNRYFYHDSGDTARWVLMGHAKQDFWRWVSQWGVCVSKPSDIGGDDAGYELPELIEHQRIVSVDEHDAAPGYLFNVAGLSATTLHEEKRLTNYARCQEAAAIANSVSGPCVVWCDTNYEADELVQLIPEAVEVRGNMDDAKKEKYLSGFASGDHRVLISKSSICGFGMNWQHCRNMVFAGLSYSFEQYYQAIRRCWRFGQIEPVNVYVIMAESENAIAAAQLRKAEAFNAMRCGMADSLRDYTLESLFAREGKTRYVATDIITLPNWINHESN